MKRAIAAVITLLSWLAPPAEARPVTVDDLMALRSIADVQISPDGRRVVYVVSQASYEKDAYEAVLYVTASTGGPPTRLTYTTRLFSRPVPAPRLRWSPDSRSVSFVALVNEAPQVMVMDLAGGEPRQVTTAKEGVAVYEWSPDWMQVAFVAPDPVSDEEERRKRDHTYVVEVDRHKRPGRLWVQAVPGGAPRAFTPADHFVSDLSWSPDGKTLAYAAAPFDGFKAQFHTRIYTIAAEGGTPRALVDRPGMNTSPTYSPDGRWLAFISSDGRAEMISIWGLHVVSSKGGPVKNLTAASGSWVGEFTWAVDSESLYYIPYEGTTARGEGMFEQPIVRVAVSSGHAEPLTTGPTVSYSLSVSRDGSRLAYRSVAAQTMGDVFVMSVADRRIARVTDVNPELSSFDLGELKPISWRSFDGMEIWGLLLTPPGHRPGRRLPLVVYCHGGPIGGFTYGLFPQFMHSVPQVDPYPTQAMASAGFAVLFPMPRGGSGYGEAGFRMIVNGWGVGDYRDIMAGVDHLIAAGVADADRLGVMGGSYGGYMTNWIVTQTGRFKAASAMCSISDIAALYYLSDAGDFTSEYFGLPWQAAATYAAHSPLTHASKVTTPLLIQHGENDARVPVSQAKALYKALKDQGKTVELEIYPRGGHVVYEPDLQREMMQRNLAWFLRWLGAEPR